MNPHTFGVQLGNIKHLGEKETTMLSVVVEQKSVCTTIYRISLNFITRSSSEAFIGYFHMRFSQQLFHKLVHRKAIKILIFGPKYQQMSQQIGCKKMLPSSNSILKNQRNLIFLNIREAKASMS